VHFDTNMYVIETDQTTAIVTKSVEMY